MQQAQRACRGQAGYVPVTVLLMLHQGHGAATVAQALGMDVSSVYRYAQSYHLQGLSGHLRAEQPGYWGLLTSSQLASLCRELGQQLYPDCRAIAHWLARTYGVRYSVSSLTDLLHRLGANARDALSYKLTTALPCRADAEAQTAFLTGTLAPAAGSSRSGHGGGLFRRRGPPHPQHPRHPRVDPNEQGTAPVDGQWPGTGQPQRRPQRPRPHPGPPRRNRLRQRLKHPAALRKTRTIAPNV